MLATSQTFRFLSVNLKRLRIDHHAVVLAGTGNGDVAVEDVFPDQFGIPFQGIAKAATTVAPIRAHITGIEMLACSIVNYFLFFTMGDEGVVPSMGDLPPYSPQGRLL